MKMNGIEINENEALAEVLASPFVSQPATGAQCSHDGCSSEAVVEHGHPDPDERFLECRYHATHPQMYCVECGKMQEIREYASGPSLGGCGRVEVWTLQCGHSGGEENDPISNYE